MNIDMKGAIVKMAAAKVSDRFQVLNRVEIAPGTSKEESAKVRKDAMKAFKEHAGDGGRADKTYSRHRSAGKAVGAATGSVAGATGGAAAGRLLADKVKNKKLRAAAVAAGSIAGAAGLGSAGAKAGTKAGEATGVRSVVKGLHKDLKKANPKGSNYSFAIDRKTNKVHHSFNTQ